MTKRSTVFSLILIVVGMLLMIISLGSCGFNFKNLDKKNYETNTHEIADHFNSISISSETADINFVPTDSEIASVVCLDNKKMPHEVGVKDGILNITINDERKWYDHITLFSSINPTITVYLPDDTYEALSIDSDTSDVKIPGEFTFDNISIELSTGDVTCLASANDFIKVNASTGDVHISDATAEDVSISISTGDVNITRCTFASLNAKTSTGDHCISELSIAGDLTANVSTGFVAINNVSCNNFTSNGSTGDICIENLNASNRFTVERSTGDIELEGCIAGHLNVKASTGDVELDRSDASEIYIKTSTGNVEGSLLTSKIFITRTNTGKVRVPASIEGGRCEISTDTGDIEITTP